MQKKKMAALPRHVQPAPYRGGPPRVYVLLEDVMAALEPQTYQARVREWVLTCFGPAIADDITERCFRFLEEALELVQAKGCTETQAKALVEYVYGRHTGDALQEVGGVMVTLAALTSAAGIDMQAEADRELARVSSPEVTAKIRRKQASKRGVVSHVAEAALPGEWTADLPSPPGRGGGGGGENNK